MFSHKLLFLNLYNVALSSALDEALAAHNSPFIGLASMPSMLSSSHVATVTIISLTISR